MPNCFEQARTLDMAAAYKACGLPVWQRLSNQHSHICGHNSLSIYNDGHNCKCHNCGRGWDAISFVSEFKGIEAVDAAKLLCREAGLSYDDKGVKVSPVSEEIYHITAFAALFADEYKRGGHDFFEKRGFSPEIIQRFCLGYIPEQKVLEDFSSKYNISNPAKLGLITDKGYPLFSGRYSIPLFTKDGAVGFAARLPNWDRGMTIGKYVNSPSSPWFNKSSFLFNWGQAQFKSKTIYIVEGPLDAISLVQIGIENVVATQGTALTDTHLQMLKSKDIVLAFDNDAAGLSKMATFIMSHPKMPLRARFLHVRYKDCNEALIHSKNPRAWWDAAIECSAPEFLLRYFKLTSKLFDVNERHDFFKQMREYLDSASGLEECDIYYYLTKTRRLCGIPKNKED